MFKFSWQNFLKWQFSTFLVARTVLLIAIIVTLCHFFIITVYVVDGQSMEPSFYNNDYLLIQRLDYWFKDPQRGEPVIIRFPGDPNNVKYIKRVIGLPGERIKIENNKVYINNKELVEWGYIPFNTPTVPSMERILNKDEYFLMGDNRQHSLDSRIFGSVPKRDFIGKAFFIFYPFNRVGYVFSSEFELK